MVSPGVSCHGPRVPTVALFGNSIVLVSVGGTLRRPGLSVVRVDPAEPDAERRLLDLQADAVMIDLAATPPEMLAHCKALPHVLLIGLDLQSDTALVLSGEPHHVVSTRELARLIEERLGLAGEESLLDGTA